MKQTLLSVVILVSACGGIERANDSKLTLDTPIEWWHTLQGGKIAEVRPPPPGVDDPYPNLGQVPARPIVTDAATRRALASRLASERDRTQREATQDPLILPAASVSGGRPTASPNANSNERPGANIAPLPPVPAPDPNASVAVMDAATAPVQPAAAPSAMPLPATPPAAAVAPAATGPRTVSQAAGSPVESGPLPDLPTTEPSLPRLGGLPASANAPAVPRVPPPVAFVFRQGSATLPAATEAALRGMAARRAGAAIAVVAGGDAAGPGAEAQARALPLALRRTRAIQDALVAAGVPAAALRIDAAALGRGGAARLLQ